jgi:hypothetical protein
MKYTLRFANPHVDLSASSSVCACVCSSVSRLERDRSEAEERERTDGCESGARPDLSSKSNTLGFGLLNLIDLNFNNGMLKPAAVPCKGCYYQA